MKNCFLLFLLVLVIPFSSYAQISKAKERFYNQVLNDFSMHSFYISIDIKSSNYCGNVVIKNGDLFDYLSSTEKITEKKYVGMLKSLIGNKGTLHLEKIDLSFYGFSKVKKNDTVLENKNDFLRHYFNFFQGVYTIKEEFIEEEPLIINRLFNWEIPCKADDETGLLFILKEWM